MAKVKTVKEVTSRMKVATLIAALTNNSDNRILELACDDALDWLAGLDSKCTALDVWNLCFNAQWMGYLLERIKPVSSSDDDHSPLQLTYKVQGESEDLPICKDKATDEELSLAQLIRCLVPNPFADGRKER